MTEETSPAPARQAPSQQPVTDQTRKLSPHTIRFCMRTEQPPPSMPVLQLPREPLHHLLPNLLTPGPPRNIVQPLARDKICVRCLKATIASDPSHVCEGVSRTHEKGMSSEVATDCHQRCRQRRVNLHHSVCLTCIEAKPPD